MDDLVERLRDRTDDTCDEAADRIEQLNSELAEAREGLKDAVRIVEQAGHPALATEIRCHLIDSKTGGMG